MLSQLLMVMILFSSAILPRVGYALESVRELPVARASLDATGFEGAVLVYDPGDDSYAAAHAERVDRRLIPASTFKILNALVALETGVVSDQATDIRWDGISRTREELNRDLDLQAAFRLSAVPHYQELARRVGAERMKQFLDAVGYGNRDMSGGIDQFWLTGGLRISPREQIEFLTRLYHDDLPFSLRSMAIVKEMMVAEETPEYTISAKTGWASPAENENVGWWVGWVEHDTQTHIFATVLEAGRPDKTFGPSRQAVTRIMLEELGVIASDH